jgi:FkbM family methyltransferase
MPGAIRVCVVRRGSTGALAEEWMMAALAPIEFDRSTGVMTGANAWERSVALALLGGSKISSMFSHRGYNVCANTLQRVVPGRDIHIQLNPDAVFSFPYADGYWSKLLNRSFKYEDELELFLLGSRDVDYTLIDCGANFGYWSVLASSKPFGSHRSIALEASSKTYARLARNAKINGGRFEALNNAIGSARGLACLSGSKHEAMSIVGAADAAGEEVAVVALDNLIDDGRINPNGKFFIKLDVEGVEVDAMKGGIRLLQADTIVVCEEHGNDPHHTVSRYIFEETHMKAIIHDPDTDRFEYLTDLATLDRLKVSSNCGYSVFATASPFWQQHILGLNSGQARRLMNGLKS